MVSITVLAAGPAYRKWRWKAQLILFADEIIEAGRLKESKWKIQKNQKMEDPDQTEIQKTHTWKTQNQQPVESN